MRAFVISGPSECGVVEVAEPEAAPGQVVVDVERVGVCGTDLEFLSGHMTYLHSGDAEYPMRIGHEWCGVVSEIGDGVDPSWLAKRVTGDTMLGCGHCARCSSGRQHLCANRFEIGIRNGFPGALAEKIAVPATSLFELPDSVDATAGAMVEPGGNSLRAVWAANLKPRDPVLVIGAGTIGLLTASFARSAGASVHLLGRSQRSLDFARAFGFDGVWDTSSLPTLPWQAVIDCSNGADTPARAVELVEPGGRAVFIGLAEVPTPIDTRHLVLNDVTAVGILSASGGLAGTIEAYASGAVDPRPLVSATISMEELPDVLAGKARPPGAGAGPKIHVDPRL